MFKLYRDDSSYSRPWETPVFVAAFNSESAAKAERDRLNHENRNSLYPCRFFVKEVSE